MFKELIYIPLREALKSVVYQGAAFLPTVFFNYIPYKHRSYSFTLPKYSAHNQETTDLDLIIPPEHIRGGRYETPEVYLSSGKEMIKKMLQLVKASDFSFAEGNRILDFGCSAGRMIRHLKNFSEFCEIWGVDIDAESIYWCKQHLYPPFNFATTTTIPHLPFEDRYFDLIYAGSVFTHIDELAEAWLLELRRILSPNGRIYITIQDNHSVELLKTANTNVGSLGRGIDLYNKAKGDFGMIVFDRNTGNTDTFYDLNYFCKSLSSIYNVLSVTKEVYGHQTAVLVKRK